MNLLSREVTSYAKGIEADWVMWNPKIGEKHFFDMNRIPLEYAAIFHALTGYSYLTVASCENPLKLPGFWDAETFTANLSFILCCLEISKEDAKEDFNKILQGEISYGNLLAKVFGLTNQKIKHHKRNRNLANFLQQRMERVVRAFNDKQDLDFIK